MLVIADTSPLNYLIQLELDHILPHIYGRVLVPSAVLKELQHPGAPMEVAAWGTNPPGWLNVIAAVTLDSSLQNTLGDGEREAISLALELHADLLLIDEMAGRTAAEARLIPVTGTMAVLMLGALALHFDFAQSLLRLRRLGFRVSSALEVRMLQEYERRSVPDL